MSWHTLSDVSYVMPIKASIAVAPDSDLTRYLEWLARHVEVIVVDGSQSAVFRAHAQMWSTAVRHVAVRSETFNGKVAGVCDGIATARRPLVIVADDDVRYDLDGLASVRACLQTHDAVMPQNYFSPAPWHARWDTGRSLLNRAFGADYAGTIGVRRSSVMEVGGYCGAVLFENLELMRTLTARGFDVVQDRSIFVARRPPTLSQFANQRVRQAYDSRAQPRRRIAELALLPVGALLARRPSTLAAGLVATTVVAALGRRRDGGAPVWPKSAPLWAVPWLLERSVTGWLAELAYWRGGASYRGRRLVRAAHSLSTLRAGRCPDQHCSCRLQCRRQPEAAPKPCVITECPAGPFLVRGAVEVIDESGRHEAARPVVGVCKCDRSSIKPWCDGTHKLLRPGWKARRSLLGGEAGQILVRTEDPEIDATEQQVGI